MCVCGVCVCVCVCVVLSQGTPPPAPQRRYDVPGSCHITPFVGATPSLHIVAPPSCRWSHTLLAHCGPAFLPLEPGLFKLTSFLLIAEFTMIVAAGPYTTSENLEMEPLQELVQVIMSERPDVLVLVCLGGCRCECVMHVL